jgi:hypothetical protein
LVIRFIGLLRLVTASISSAIANSHTLQFTAARTKSFSLLCLPQLPSNVFQLRTFFSFRVPRLWYSLVVTHLTNQLGVAWLQSSKKGNSSLPQGSRTALPNRRLKTDSRDYTSQITKTNRLVFPVTVFTALLEVLLLQARGYLTKLIRRCYATAYINWGSSASHASVRGECLMLALSRALFHSRLTKLCFDSPDIASPRIHREHCSQRCSHRLRCVE